MKNTSEILASAKKTYEKVNKPVLRLSFEGSATVLRGGGKTYRAEVEKNFGAVTLCVMMALAVLITAKLASGMNRKKNGKCCSGEENA